ncbi:efflux RND transporter periplasmic adaptor subunit [Aurantibacter crassamenti]|uniref:efflux RND transporter periplasmic adaptor subunit n=1 Tax=Aurantibacter crassamenti TaxID=1837375 RepID=UPI00193A9AA0|nr:HlyD family efflux transporter periplasmic adaptor subunit [Aurantibacter crassamenti]MBM1106571.1 efflux RND transporter periplasmic adaptor subunit [Aurantibacter crassamenti]
MNATNSYSIVLGILFFSLVLSCGSKQDKILPQKSSLTESVYSSVTIQPDSLYQAYAIVAGILDKNLVEEGAIVAKGDAILQVVNTTPSLNTDNAKLSFQLAKENYSGSSGVLKSIRDQIAAAQLKLKNDSINYYRQKRLWKQKIGSKVEFDNRKLAFELSQNNVSLLRSEYQRTQNELRTKVQQANNNFKTAQVATTDFTVSSKINGKVYALFKNTGELVNTMEPLASIGSANTFIIEMLVDEVDIVKVKLHQKVVLTLDAYQDQIFEAEVIKIYPRKDSRSQTFKVEAVFDNQPEVLYPGLSGEGNIIIAQRKNTVVIPKAYLIDDTKVLTDDGLVEVKTGLQNLDKIEILEGINANTYILKPEE